jgi:hypothetical protein
MLKKGYKQTIEHKRKIGLANSVTLKGKKLSAEHIKNSANARKGLHRSEKTRKKMSESAKGEKNSMFGKSLSEKHKEKIGEALIGRVGGMQGKHHSEKAKKKIGLGNKGKVVSIKAKEKMSKAKKGKKRWWYSPTEFKKGNKGSKCFAWKGGKSIENQLARGSIEIKDWRKKVFRRDDYTCQKTGIKGGKLCAHHIKNFSKYPNLRHEIDNGITLSEKVHDKFHEIYGRRNNTKKQLIEFFSTV